MTITIFLFKPLYQINKKINIEKSLEEIMEIILEESSGTVRIVTLLRIIRKTVGEFVFIATREVIRLATAARKEVIQTIKLLKKQKMKRSNMEKLKLQRLKGQEGRKDVKRRKL